MEKGYINRKGDVIFYRINIKKYEKKITYSVQFRKKVVKLQLSGESFIQLSKRF